MSVTLCIRTGHGGTTVAISGEIDVSTEAQLQQSLLRIIRERPAKLMLDVSGVSFMDCAGLRALLVTRHRAEVRGVHLRLIATSAAVRRIVELTDAEEALAMEQSPTDRSVQMLRRTDRMRRTDRSVCQPSCRSISPEVPRASAGPAGLAEQGCLHRRLAGTVRKTRRWC